MIIKMSSWEEKLKAQLRNSADDLDEWEDIFDDMPEEEKQQKKVYVYFIKKEKFVKIGSSINPEQRLQTLQTANNQKLELLYKASHLNEKEVQTKFDRYKDHNEWFYFSREIKDFIQKDKENDYSDFSELIEFLEEIPTESEGD